jgi:hypothetical protein
LLVNVVLEDGLAMHDEIVQHLEHLAQPVFSVSSALEDENQ